MRRLDAVIRLLPLALLAIRPATATVRYYDVTGSTAGSENACPLWVLQDTHDDCSYNKSDPYDLGTLEWIGPVFSAGYYAAGSAPQIFVNTVTPTPVVAPDAELPLDVAKTGIPITRGFISIDDKDTADTADDVIGGTIEFGPFSRNVATGATTRVVETFDRVIQTISVPAAGASNVSAATPNAGGGLDYVVGLSGTSSAFPTVLTGSTTSNGGFADSFPSQVGSQSSTDAADVPYWSAADANGIADYEGATAIAGSKTTATVWGYSCDAGTGPGSCVTTSVNWDTDARAGLDNLLLRLSTDGSGNITAASAFLVNEFRITPGNGVNDSWVATTLSFTGTGVSMPVAFDDRATLNTGGASPDPDVTVDVLANDLPGVAPVTVSIVSQGTLGTAAVLTTPAGSVNFIRYTPNSAGLPAGQDSVTYRITDANNDTSDATLAIVLQNDHPVAVDDSVTAENGVIKNVFVLDNDKALSDSPITITITTLPTHGNAFVVPEAGNRAALIRYGSDATYAGPDSLQYQLTDANGDVSNVATLSIDVIDSTPVAVPDTPTVEHGVTTTIDVLANDTGIVDKPLVINVTTLPMDGTAVVVPASGDTNPTVKYTPTSGFTGTDTFSYTVTDSDGNVSPDPATVTVTVRNTIPVANPDVAAISIRAPININVLANDTGKTNQPITVEITQPPTLGSARAIAPAASPTGVAVIEYTSAVSSAGTDVFKYRMRDADGDTSSDATVTITVINATPGVVDDPTQTIQNDTPTRLDPLANDVNLNNGPLTITFSQNPAHGSVSVIAGTGLGNPTVAYTPASGYVGADSFRYRLRDADGDTSPTDALVPLDVVDTPPHAGDDIQNGDAREPTAVDVLLTDTGLFDLPVTLQITQQPTHGTAAMVTVVRSNGTSWPGISYASDVGSSGDDTVKYTVTDRDGNVSNEGTLTLTVTDAVPAAVNDTGGDPGLLPSSLGLDVVVEQLSTPMDVLVNDTGRNNRPLTLTIMQAPAHGTAVVASAADTGTGRPGVTYQGAVGYVGSDSFSYTFTDGDGQVSNEATVTFDIVSLPTATADGQPFPLRTNMDTPITVNVLQNDGGLAYGPIKVEVVNPVSGTAVVNADNTVTYTPDPGFTGRFPAPDCQPFVCPSSAGGGFRYRITDAYGQSAEGNAFVDVLAPPVTDSSGSSSLDAEMLALLAAAGVIRRRARGLRPNPG